MEGIGVQISILRYGRRKPHCPDCDAPFREVRKCNFAGEVMGGDKKEPLPAHLKITEPPFLRGTSRLEEPHDRLNNCRDHANKAQDHSKYT